MSSSDTPSAVERAIQDLRKRTGDPHAEEHWLDRVCGSFANDPVFAEMVELGQQIRKADQVGVETDQLAEDETETAMATALTSLEDRVANLERIVTELQEKQAKANKTWLEEVLGSFRGDPDFAEVIRYGRQIREADRPRDSE